MPGNAWTRVIANIKEALFLTVMVVRHSFASSYPPDPSGAPKSGSLAKI